MKFIVTQEMAAWSPSASVIEMSGGVQLFKTYDVCRRSIPTFTMSAGSNLITTVVHLLPTPGYTSNCI